MWLSQDDESTDWTYFIPCVNERFGPPTRRNPLGELAALRKAGIVDEYTERFLEQVAHTGNLNKQQHVNIYTTGLLEPLKTDVELHHPQNMETAMSLARAYKRRLKIVAKSNKAPVTKPGRLPPPKAPTTSASPATPSATPPSVTSPPSRPFKRLTLDEMVERRRAGLCFNCDEPFACGHKCKMLFEITMVNDCDMDDNSNLMMIIGKNK